MDEKNKNKSTQSDTAELTFEEAMRKIISVPKKEVEDAIKAEKKKPRGQLEKKG